MAGELQIWVWFAPGEEGKSCSRQGCGASWLPGRSIPLHVTAPRFSSRRVHLVRRCATIQCVRHFRQTSPRHWQSIADPTGRCRLVEAIPALDIRRPRPLLRLAPDSLSVVGNMAQTGFISIAFHDAKPSLPSPPTTFNLVLSFCPSAST